MIVKTFLSNSHTKDNVRGQYASSQHERDQNIKVSEFIAISDNDPSVEQQQNTKEVWHRKSATS